MYSVCSNHISRRNKILVISNQLLGDPQKNMLFDYNTKDEVLFDVGVTLKTIDGPTTIDV